MAKTHQASAILHNHRLSLFHFPSSPIHFNKPLLFLSSSSSIKQCNNLQLTRVSTVPFEYSTPTPPESDDFSSEIHRLKSLLQKLDVSKDLRRKQKVIDSDSRVRRFFTENHRIAFLASLGLDSREMFLLKCVIAAGQQHSLCVEPFEGEGEEEEEYTVRSSVKNALYALVEMIERFDVNTKRYNGRRETSLMLDAEKVGDFKKFLTFLGEIEQFYDCIGGIIGYWFLSFE